MTTPFTNDTLRNKQVTTTTTTTTMDDTATSSKEEQGLNSYELAINQSFNFFNDIPGKQWEMHREIYLQNTNHINPMDP